MIVTTTPTVEGRPVKNYLCVVTGEAVLTGSLNDLGEAFKSVGTGHSAYFERKFHDAGQQALKRLADRAGEFGANAVVGVLVDYEETRGGVMVIATGTAVVIP